MKKIKMKDTILSHYQKVHELEMDGLTVRVWKPRTMQQLPAHMMKTWLEFRVRDAVRYMHIEGKSAWHLGNPDYGLWDAQTVYHYDPRRKAFDIYFAALLVRPFSKQAYEYYCQQHDNILDVNQRLMLMWDSREFDRIGGYDTSYGAYKDQALVDVVKCRAMSEDEDLEDTSPDFYGTTGNTAADTDVNGLVFRFRNNGDKLENSTTWPKECGPVPEGFQDKMKVCLDTFIDFTEKHPEFPEVHFYTKPTEWENDDTL